MNYLQRWYGTPNFIPIIDAFFIFCVKGFSVYYVKNFVCILVVLFVTNTGGRKRGQHPVGVLRAHFPATPGAVNGERQCPPSPGVDQQHGRRRAHGPGKLLPVSPSPASPHRHVPRWGWRNHVCPCESSNFLSRFNCYFLYGKIVFFSQVLNRELLSIRRACESFAARNPKLVAESGFKGGRYEPPVTFIVVQKRHHTRLFCVDPRVAFQML